MNGFTTLLASDVHERDGLGLELYDPSGHMTAEIFREDLRSTTVFWSDAQVELPLDILQWFVARAHEVLLS